MNCIVSEQGYGEWLASPAAATVTTTSSAAATTASAANGGDDGDSSSRGSSKYAFAMDPILAQVTSMEVVPPKPASPTSFDVDPAVAARVHRVDQVAYRSKAHGSSASATASSSGEAAVDDDAPATSSSFSSTSGNPLPNCLQWVASLPAGMPSYGPTRHVKGISADFQVPDLVLATHTDPELDTNGVLHAFDAATGAELWTHKAIDDSGTWWGLTGVVPAVDPLRGNLIYIAYGGTVRAIDAVSGNVMASLSSSGVPDPAPATDYIMHQATRLSDGDDLFNVYNLTFPQAVDICNGNSSCVGFMHHGTQPYPPPGELNRFFFKKAWKASARTDGWTSFQKPGFGLDPFVSSPVLSPPGNVLFLHSAAGTLWRITIAGPAGSQSVTMTIEWGCDYVVNAAANYSTCLSPPAVFKRSFPAPVYNRDGDGVVRPSATQRVYRGDYLVSGGWTQATTRAERDALHAMIRDSYLQQLQLEADQAAAVGASSSTTNLRSSSSPSSASSSAAAAEGPASSSTPALAMGINDAALLSTVKAGVQPSVAAAAAMVRYLRSKGKLSHLHSLRAGSSGYTKLGSDGNELHASTIPLTGSPPRSSSAAALPATWQSVYPYSTPAIEENIFMGLPAIVVPQYMPYASGDEGFFACDVSARMCDDVWRVCAIFLGLLFLLACVSNSPLPLLTGAFPLPSNHPAAMPSLHRTPLLHAARRRQHRVGSQFLDDD